MILRSGTRLVAFILSFKCFIDHYLVMCEVLTCNPAEIGSNHEVIFNVTSNCTDNQPRVDSHDGVLAKCPNYSLLLNIPTNYKFTVTTQNSNYSTLTLMIRNISMTKNDTEVYFNIDNYGTGPTKKCTILLYQIAKNLKCSTNITKDELRVDCLSSEMYPGGPCVIETNLKNVTFEKKDINVSSTSKGAYISKKCTLSVPVASLTYGKTTVNVTVYPNVTGNKDDKYTYGTKTIMVINLERPSVRLSMDTCPSTVKEGENVTCHCERTDSSDVDVVVSWYVDATRDFATPDMVKSGSIFFKGLRNNEAVYYCKSSNTFGWESNPVYYQPTLLFPQKIYNFSVNGQVNEVTIEPSTTISFFCEAEEADNQLIAITKDGEKLEWANSKTIAWNITSARCDDTGVYRCNVSRCGEWTHAEINVTVCEKNYSSKAESPEAEKSLVTLISIGAGGLAGMLIIVIVFFTVKIQFTMFIKTKCPNKHEVELDTSDIYKINFSYENAETKPFAEVKNNNVMKALVPESRGNYSNVTR